MDTHLLRPSEFEGKPPDISNNNEAEMYAAVLGLQRGLEFWSELYPDTLTALP